MGEKMDLIKSMAAFQGSIRDQVAMRHPERKWRYETTLNYYELVCKAKDAGRPVACVNFATIPELFWAMGIVPISMDTITGIACSSAEGAARYIDLAEEHFPDHICTTNKISIGAMLAGDIPVPDMIVHPSSPCDSALTAYPAMAEHFGIPYFCIDTPYFRNEQCYQYLTQELRRLVSFLESQTGEKLNPDKLRQVMEYSNQAHEYVLKVNELICGVPCPIRSMDIILDFNSVSSLAGTPQLVDYVKTRYETTRDIVSKGIGALPQERLRLVWIYAMPVYDWSIYGWLERNHGAISISALNVFDIPPVEDISSVDSILRGLAMKTTNVPMVRECGGPWEYYIERVLELVRMYKADAAVFGGHIACKHTWAIAKLIKDRLFDELGISTLTIELDVFDPRITSSEEVKAKLDEFLSVIVRKK